MVTASDINRVANKYFIQLFDPAHFSCAVCCNSNKVTETQEGLEGWVWSVCGVGVVCLLTNLQTFVRLYLIVFDSINTVSACSLFPCVCVCVCV